jgi:hypothetical protein
MIPDHAIGGAFGERTLQIMQNHISFELITF